MLISKEKEVSKYLDEEGDFVLACLRTCEDNLWETILGCIIQALPSWLLKVPNHFLLVISEYA